MSSENRPLSSVSWTAIVVIIISAVIYTHQKEITDALIAFVWILGGFALLGLIGLIAYRFGYLPEIIVILLDLEPPIKKKAIDRDAISKEKVESQEEPEPEAVQSAPARQESAKATTAQEGYWKIQSVDSSAEDALLGCPLHLAEGLAYSEVSSLERHGFFLKEFVPLGKTRREKYYIQEQKPESFEHTFIVYNLVAKLKPLVQSIEVRRTQRPDIVFYYGGDRYALEVETPHNLPRKHARLSRKAKQLTREYGVRWWFVTTRSAYAKTFRPYGDVLTRNQIDQWIKNTFTPLPQPPP